MSLIRKASRRSLVWTKLCDVNPHMMRLQNLTKSRAQPPYNPSGLSQPYHSLISPPSRPSTAVAAHAARNVLCYQVMGMFNHPQTKFPAGRCRMDDAQRCHAKHWEAVVMEPINYTAMHSITQKICITQNICTNAGHAAGPPTGFPIRR